MKNILRKRNALYNLSKGDLVTQCENHRSHFCIDLGIGTVADFDSIYVRVFWPKLDKTISMRKAELEVIYV